MHHKAYFQEVSGATELAWSTGAHRGRPIDYCAAFRVNDHPAAYGLQFHPEPTAAMLTKGWFPKSQPASDELSRLDKIGRRMIEDWLQLALRSKPSNARPQADGGTPGVSTTQSAY